MKKKKEDVSQETIEVVEEIDWYLNDKELEECKNKMLAAMEETDRLAIEKKQKSDEYKSLIQLEKTKTFECRKALNTGKIKKKANVQVFFNFNTNKKTAVHPQTGEIIWEKDLTDDDKQKNFL